MNKSTIIILILVLVGTGAVVVTQQKQKAARMEQERIAEEAKKVAIAAEEERQRALETARKAAAEAERVRQIALAEARKLEEEAKQKATDLQIRISGLVVQAKGLFDDGKYKEAISVAKNILTQDADNAEGKSILEAAQAKLKEVAEQKAASLVKENPKEALGALTSELGNKE